MPGNKSPTAPNPWTQSTRRKGRWPTPAIAAMVTHHLHPQRTDPTAPSWQRQTAQYVIPIVPNATKWDIGDPNAMVAGHSSQGMHLHQGHSRGSPDAHLGATTAAKGRTTRQTPQMSKRTTALKMK